MIKLEVEHNKHQKKKQLADNKSGTKLKSKKAQQANKQQLPSVPVKAKQQQSVNTDKQTDKKEKKEKKSKKKGQKDQKTIQPQQTKSSKKLAQPAKVSSSNTNHNNNNSYFNTIDSIQKQQEKAKLTIEDLIKQYKNSSDDIFTNHGHNPEKQTLISHKLSLLQKQKQERALKLQKARQIEEKRRQRLQQKEVKKQQGKINRAKSRIKKKAEQKIEQIQQQAQQRMIKEDQFREHYEQFKKRQFRYKKYSEQAKEREKEEEIQRKLKLKMIHRKYSPIDMTQLKDFEEEYAQQKWGRLEEQQKKREFQQRMLADQNANFKKRLWKGQCHRNVHKEKQQQRQKAQLAKSMETKKKDYATSIQTTRMPVSVRQSSMSSVISQLQRELTEGSQSPTLSDGQQESRCKKVIGFKFFQGKNEGPILETRKIPLDHSEKAKKGNQYLSYLHSLPKNHNKSILQRKQPQEGQQKLTPKPDIVKIEKEINPYYRKPTRVHAVSIPNRQSFDYSLAKIDKINKSIDLEQKSIKFSSYVGVLDLQKRKNAHTRNIVQTISAKLDILSNI